MSPSIARRGALYALVALAALTAACGGGSGLRTGASVEEIAAAPRLLNGDEVIEAIRLEYPAALRDQGVGGVVRLRLLVGRDGAPVEVRLLDTSSFPLLDQAALRVARVLRFDPARDRDGRPVEVWASFPIAFQAP